LPRFVVMGEAMMALVLVDHWLRWRAQCCLGNKPDAQ
jgi:chorismate synthase